MLNCQAALLHDEPAALMKGLGKMALVASGFHQTGERVPWCVGLCLMGGSGGQQLRPTHGSAVAVGRDLMCTLAIPMPLAAMMRINERMETAITFMAEAPPN